MRTETPDERNETLEKASEFVGFQALDTFLDALQSVLHNTAQTLDGNTPESDLEWFAKFLYRAAPKSRAAWDHLEEAERDLWRGIAKNCLDALPYLMSRIATRYKAYENVLRDMTGKMNRERYRR